jgi:hypothetical protein
MRRVLVIAHILGMLIPGLVATGTAAVIDNFPTQVDCPPSGCNPKLVSPLGEQGAGGDQTTASYFAQSFTVPRPGIARMLAFQLQSLIGGPLGDDDVEFRVLVTDSIVIDGNLHPQDVLFESDDLVMPQGLGLTTFRVRIGPLSLEQDTPYFWILDTAVLADGEIGAASVGMRFGYPGGAFYTTNVGAANWPTDPGTRDDHFASDLFYAPFGDADLAFQLIYSVPEPATLWPVIAGSAIAFSMLCRRRRPI